ncbi:hypothetical protein Tco_0133801 [Tanacetum coccineum]
MKNINVDRGFNVALRDTFNENGIVDRFKIVRVATGLSEREKEKSILKSGFMKLRKVLRFISDLDESRVTHTGVSSPFEDLSDIGSPRADDHEYLELPGMPEDPYMEAALQALPSPDYVPGQGARAGIKPTSPDATPIEDPVDYPADGGDDEDDEDEPSEEDEDDDVDIEADEDEERRSTQLLPTL